jgi:hypothetical protein
MPLPPDGPPAAVAAAAMWAPPATAMWAKRGRPPAAVWEGAGKRPLTMVVVAYELGLMALV